MEKIELNNETKDLLLEQLFEYRYQKETNINALIQLKGVIEQLSSTFSENGNTLAYQSSRIKEENSFLNKVYNKANKGLDVNFEDIHDIVGLRLVCLSLSDVYDFVDLLKKSELLNVLEEKDYISNPKDSGYMSYHIIVDVPTVTQTGVRNIKCEIQLRTIFMDIFSREEHKLSYKGYSTEEEKKTLKTLSEKLYFYDCALDNLFKTSNNTLPDEDLKAITQEYDKISYIYGIVYDKIQKKIKEYVADYSNKSDILHINGRLKPIKSIKRKLKKRHLECTAENILYNTRDVVGFKIVAIDEVTARDFINYFLDKVNAMERFEVTHISDNLTEPKNSGYRGYKMNLSYHMPTLTGKETITIEIIIRTMVMDAWALHDDKIFNDENTKETTKRQLKGLSPALKDVEVELSNLKTNSSEESNQIDLVSQIEEYQAEKRTKKLTLNKNENN